MPLNRFPLVAVAAIALMAIPTASLTADPSMPADASVVSPGTLPGGATSVPRAEVARPTSSRFVCPLGLLRRALPATVSHQEE